jgi:ATP-binding cassette subfamily B protein
MPESNSLEESVALDTRGFDLKVENLSFRFPGQKLLLVDVSLSVKPGEMIALLGESGSGKSTLIQILQKLYEPEAGYIELHGRKLSTISTSTWRNLIGVVPQDIKIFNGSLLYNIALSDNPNELSGAFRFCNDLGFDTYFNKFPQSYSTILGEEGINISGGQKQLVALARALFKKPKLLMLDEATSAMDRHTEKFILELIAKLRNEISIILVTHKTESARLADRIYLLENGTISMLGSTADIYTASSALS